MKNVQKVPIVENFTADQMKRTCEGASSIADMGNFVKMLYKSVVAPFSGPFVCYDQSDHMPEPRLFTPQQLLFKELFVGTLIYAVVLGFFNDYTSVVSAKSSSTIFLASIVLEILTFLAFLLKKKIIRYLRGREGAFHRFLKFFSVWLVLFLSKFVFVWSINLLFGGNIYIYGFFGILAVVASVTIIHSLADWVFKKLGNQASAT